MTRFLPARIFSVSVLSYCRCAVCLGLRARLFGVRTDVPGVEEDRTGCEEVARDSKSQFGAEVETRARLEKSIFFFFFLLSAFSCVLMLLFSCLIMCFVMYNILNKHVNA